MGIIGYVYGSLGSAMSRLDSLDLTPELLVAIGAIDEFKGRWSALGRLAPERLAALRRVATIESVGSSTRIEGARMTDAQVDQFLRGLRTDSFRSRDEQEVAGYSELMALIFESWREIPLTQNHILHLHGVLLRYSEEDARHRGLYKTHPNHVEAFDEAGNSLGIVFETATPFDTPRLMEELLHRTNRAFETDAHHSLLIIATFVIDFLAIHPVQDGNGRLSRALTTLLMLRAGYAYVPYASLERIIEDNKDEYYRSLRSGQSKQSGQAGRSGRSGRSRQAGPSDDGAGLIDWVLFFVRCLVAQKNALTKKLEQERIIGALPPLSEQLMGIVRHHGRVTVRDAVALSGANRNTIKSHLKKLVADRLLAQRGRGRGTWYERPSTG